MEPLRLLLVLAAGCLAGFINVSAGGGSLLTLPALVFLGLPPTIANGTNRIAILGQNAVSIARFRKGGLFQPRLAVLLALPAVVGAVIGARFAVGMQESQMRVFLAVVMLLVLTAILFGRRGGKDESLAEPRRRLPLYFLFFLVGLYGGVIQAGVGFFIILLLHNLGGLSMVRTNSLKVLIVAIYTIPAIAVFLAGGKIAWIPALVLTAGNAAGGWMGTVFNIRHGERWIKAVLAAAVIASALKLMLS